MNERSYRLVMKKGPNYNTNPNDVFPAFVNGLEPSSNIASEKVGYRYGFNGMEKDDEMYGSGNSFDFGERMYDPRLGRWCKVDPKAYAMPWMSPYSFALNSPLVLVDEEGEYPKPSEILEGLGIEVSPFVGGLMDGFVSGLGIFDALEFGYNLATDAKFRDELIESFETIASDPIAFAESVVDDYISKGKAIASGSEEGQYIMGEMIGELVGGVVSGGAAIKVIKMAKNFKASRLAKKVIKKADDLPVTNTPAKKVPEQKKPVAKKEVKLTNKELAAKYRATRPKFRKGVVSQVWENAKDASGKVLDPNNPNIELKWDPTKSRSGQWDMGHRPGHEYRDLLNKLEKGEINEKQFLDEYNNPKNYYPEDPSSNRSHKYEASPVPKPGSKGSGTVPRA